MSKKYLDKSIAFLLATAFFLSVPMISEAAPVNGRDENGHLTAMKDNVKPNSHDAKKASVLAKATGLSRSKISSYLNKGYEEEDIKTIYVVKVLSGKKLDEVANKYDSFDRDQKKLLDEYKIDEESFSKKCESIFKSMDEGDEHLRDRVKWRKAPFE